MSFTEDPPRVRRPRGLRFFYQDVVMVAERFRKSATDEKGVLDEALWITKVAGYFNEHRDVFNADAAAIEAVGLLKKRHNALHRERIKLGEIYVPMIIVPIGLRKSQKMKDMTAPTMLGWHNGEEKARRGATKIIDAIAARADFRTANLAAMAANPDLKTLHDVQVHVFGYVPKPEDDKEIDPTSAEAESAAEDDGEGA